MTAITRYPDIWKIRQRNLRVAIAVGTVFLIVFLFRRVDRFTQRLNPYLRLGGGPSPYDSDYDVLGVLAAPPPYHGALKFQHPSCGDGDGCRVLSRMPFIAHYPAFMSDEDCDAIVFAAQGLMGTPSLAVAKVWMDAANGVVWVPPAVRRLRDRLSDLSGLKDTGSMSSVQVVRYLAGDHSGADVDYEDDNRAVTHSVYLATVPDGGETWFPRANGGPVPRDNRSCRGGLRVRPVKGDMVVLYNMLPSTGGSRDPYSLQGGCVVPRDVKWVARVWMGSK